MKFRIILMALVLLGSQAFAISDEPTENSYDIVCVADSSGDGQGFDVTNFKITQVDSTIWALNVNNGQVARFLSKEGRTFNSVDGELFVLLLLNKGDGNYNLLFEDNLYQYCSDNGTVGTLPGGITGRIVTE